ncbi:hypothetical protein AYI71_00925 [Limosilactobacillus oris]|nr:hypothetical protein AYI71_00925 [Limosilactobacillus oris]
MPKRTDIHKILVIGSGPIIIGQAAEFDYSGTQACLALREEGYETVLVNSNPATIMTDNEIADRVYIEPLTVESVSRIIRKEYPDAILPTLGGQIGLNLAVALSKTGLLDELGIQLLGTKLASIDEAEDREKFKELMQRLGEPVPASQTVETVDEALAFAHQIGYPVMNLAGFTQTLQGTNRFSLRRIMVREMEIVNVNIVHPKAFQALVDLLGYEVRVVADNFPSGRKVMGPLRCNHQLFPPVVLDYLSHELFRVPQAVDIGRVQEVDSVSDSGVNELAPRPIIQAREKVVAPDRIRS